MTGFVEESIVALSRSVELMMLAKVTATLLLGLIAVGLARRARAAVRHLRCPRPSAPWSLWCSWQISCRR